METVLWLLDHGGANVNVTEENEKTALMCAAEKGHVEVVAALLQHGAEIDRVDEPNPNAYSHRNQTTGKTALGKAIGLGHTAVVQLLTEKGASPVVFESEEFFGACDRGEIMILQYIVNNKLMDINAKNAKGHSGLHLACEWGNLSAVSCLVEGGADMSIKSSSGRTALRVAAVKGHVDVASYLLKKGANVNETDAKGMSCLSAAASAGHGDMVDFLLKNGADPITIDDELFRKVAKGNMLGLVRHAIFAGKIDVNSQDTSDGTAAIHVASAKGNLAIVEFLVECPSIDVNIKDKEGETAIYYALGGGKSESRYGYQRSSSSSSSSSSSNRATTEIINCLLKSGVTITENAFRMAAKKGLFDFVQRVINEGILDLNAQNKSGETALIFAASKGHLKIVALLLEKNVDVNVVTKAGNALMEAAENGHLAVVEALVKAGGNVNLSNDPTNSGGKTPLWYACDNGNEDIVRYLISNGE